MQTLLEIDKTEEEKIKEYTDFLVSLGFVVISPKDIDTTSVKNAADLVDLFYATLQFYNQTRDIHYGKSSKKDLSLARNLIRHRQEVCGNKKRGLQESAAIIKCVIKHEALFCFSEPLHSLDCFGSDSMKWVIDRAISILNEENALADKVALEDLDKRLAKKHEEQSLAQLDDKITQLKGFLGEEDGEGKE